MLLIGANWSHNQEQTEICYLAKEHLDKVMLAKCCRSPIVLS